ncbi:lycopene cyclase domain-containing protein [Propionibacteriaceae bacterium Y2011]|uniref:lycopene cyclase domain-containing protein n=1 Tax=Microlunatus sp. Y2014 TaxID=3418488 RepID=UPI003B4566F0
MNVVYLAVLCALIGCMVLLDRRFGLVFWRNARHGWLLLVIGVLFFGLWDLAGIGLGIFFRAPTTLMTGVLLAPELPLEELFFLVFLCYLTLVLYAGSLRLVGRRDGAA